MANHPHRKRILFTLQDIRDAHPCADGWTKLLKTLPKGVPMTTRLSLGDIAVSNGVDDALWALHIIDFSDVSVRRRVIAGFVLPAALRASKNTDDVRVHDCLKTVARWCEGKTVDLESARAAAESARAAVESARAAVESAWAVESARAARAAVESAWAVESARAARAAVGSARAARAARAARLAEIENQRFDIIKAFAPAVLTQ